MRHLLELLRPEWPSWVSFGAAMFVTFVALELVHDERANALALALFVLGFALRGIPSSAGPPGPGTREPLPVSTTRRRVSFMHRSPGVVELATPSTCPNCGDPAAWTVSVAAEGRSSLASGLVVGTLGDITSPLWETYDVVCVQVCDPCHRLHVASARSWRHWLCAWLGPSILAVGCAVDAPRAPEASRGAAPRRGAAFDAQTVSGAAGLARGAGVFIFICLPAAALAYGIHRRRYTDRRASEHALSTGLGVDVRLNKPLSLARETGLVRGPEVFWTVDVRADDPLWVLELIRLNEAECDVEADRAALEADAAELVAAGLRPLP